MATEVRLRRGTAAEHEVFVGAPAEVTVDTTNNTLRVHDGETLGGHETMPRGILPSPIVPDTFLQAKADGSGYDGKTPAQVAEVVGPLILAAAFQGANQSLTSNGYQKLPSGLIIQWGVANLGSNLAGPDGGSSVIGIITFPIAFPTGPFSASVTCFGPGSTGSESIENFLSIQGISSSNLVVDATRVTGSGAANEILSVAWIAVGH